MFPLVMPTGDDGPAYEIERSLLCDGSSYLSRTPASAGNRRTWTWSGWVKRGALGTYQTILATTDNYTSSSNYAVFRITNTDALTFLDYSSAYRYQYVTTAKYRDTSAWYHIVLAFDTTQPTTSERIKIFVNGERVTSFSSSTSPALNLDSYINNNEAHYVMATGSAGVGPTSKFDGHVTETYLIDGQALTADDFGEINPTTGQWVPKAYAGTYGTNGFYLPLNNNASTATLGEDASGNGNDWTLSGFTTDDSVTDTPTNNFPTWSPIDKGTVTLSGANLVAQSALDVHAVRATQALPSTGKWYWEIKSSGLGYAISLGIADNASVITTGPASAQTRTFQWGSWFNSNNGGVPHYGTNQGVTAGASWSGASQVAADDIIMIAVDMDNGAMWVGKNGTWFNSSGTANPATNTDPRWTALEGTEWFPYHAAYGSFTPVAVSANFGQKPFAYTPPAGFLSLCTKNLPDPIIANPKLYHDTLPYTGTGSAQSITGAEFQPDLAWIKERSGAADHALYDSVRGAQARLESNTTGAEVTSDAGLTAFNADGISVNTLAQVNTNTDTYAAWLWKEGVIPGFDIVSYTGDGVAGRTVAHGLGDAPAMIIAKELGVTSNWLVYHKGVASDAETDYLLLSETGAAVDSTTAWNDTAPTASVITLGSGNAPNRNAGSFIAYLFAEVPGFSAFGSYTGNGSTDGPFVHCGFRPAWVMIKRVDAANSWVVWDTKRNTYNQINDNLYFDRSNAENNDPGIDVLSSGFKVRGTPLFSNANTGTYIYAAFAEAPFKYANAR